MVGGAAIGVGSVVAGTAAGIGGGLGGAYMNVRDGSKEIYDSATGRKRGASASAAAAGGTATAVPAAQRPSSSTNTMRSGPPLLLKDGSYHVDRAVPPISRQATAEMGKEIWNAAMTESSSS